MMSKQKQRYMNLNTILRISVAFSNDGSCLQLGINQKKQRYMMSKQKQRYMN